MWAGAVGAVLSVTVAAWLLLYEWPAGAGHGAEPRGPRAPGRLLSRQELSRYDGEEGSRGLYLALLGQVFDVQAGRRHYGPGGAYHSMAGKDASLSFITGDFTEPGATDDVSGVPPLQVVILQDWLDFYLREYPAVGLLTGRFYDDRGQPTAALLHVRALLAEGQRIRDQSEAHRTQSPPCNSEWSAGKGGRVWCSTRSGGVMRDWAGVPRKRFSPGSSGWRCVCVRDPAAADPNLQNYDGCPPLAHSCPVGED